VWDHTYNVARVEYYHEKGFEVKNELRRMHPEAPRPPDRPTPFEAISTLS
jgi:hypothetical protein